jgi:cytochrome oxidase assembly protein ShyY1
VLAPPAPPDAPVVLVDRGLVPGPLVGAFLDEDAAAPSRPVEVTGRLVPLALQPVVPGSAPERRREWLRFDPARPDAVSALQAQLSRPLAPVAIEAEEGAAGALPRGGVTRPTSPVDHVAYALFWFALAIAAVGNWVAFGFHQAQQARRAADRGMLPSRAESAPERGDDG